MKILVANLGSTSFKYRLFEVDGGTAVPCSKGGFENVTDYTACIDAMLESLAAEGHIREDGGDVGAVGFKTVLGKDLSGCVEADDRVLEALDALKEVAPAHNPAYAAGIRSFREKLPSATPVALFETAFYQWMPPGASNYAIPKQWRDLGVRRYGFHGASHKFIAERTAELMGNEEVARRTRRLYLDGPAAEPAQPLRLLSCHLGGSSSISGIRSGVAIGNSFGFSPQSGLPHNNRVGDLDSMALPFICKTSGVEVEEAKRQLNEEGGLLGLSGVGNDLRKIKEAADTGDADARLALDVLIDGIRHWAGAYFFKMGGAEAIAFTGGIGENNPWLRAEACSGLESLGLHLDPDANERAQGGAEGDISTEDSPIRAFVIPANEELVIAREVYRFKQGA